MLYLFSTWCVMAVVIVSLAGYRKLISRKEDDLVHLGAGDGAVIDAQESVDHRLQWIDKWGKILTVVTVAFGLVLGSVYLYNGWIASSQIQN